MATTQANRFDLLEAVRQLDPEEFNSFIEQALSSRTQPAQARLTKRESRLIEQINQGLAEDITGRYERLTRKRRRTTLSPEEQAELLELTAQMEDRDAKRAAALLELSKLRRVPVRALMKQMGIKAAPVHG
jgi:hypothetical protein